MATNNNNNNSSINEHMNIGRNNHSNSNSNNNDNNNNNNSNSNSNSNMNHIRNIINSNSNNNHNSNSSRHRNIIRRNRQNVIEYLRRMELPLMLPVPQMAPQMERYARRALPLQPQRAHRGQMHAWGTMGNEGQAGDIATIGDNHQVVGIPTVAPPNHMAHMGGGDAELYVEEPLAAVHRGAGDGLQHFDHERPVARQVILPPRRETLEQRRERSVQQILRLCDFIQQQLATIAAQINAYEQKLAQHNAQSSSPPEPDGDVI